ncbi:FACR1-like protein [Mya arenaria]|uniref:FACR1-like protein n=1 Tax=Mya arenaria TaxID=6604 RepID=A0ABY7DV07_MYAAR|nr:FACR1-like protein [Mya arenaria]
MKGDHDATADLIPADLATNMLIAKLSFDCLMKNPLENVARIPNPRFTKSVVWHDANVLFDHLLPAYVMDLYMWLSGRRRMFVRIQDKLRKAVGTLEFFTTREWQFSYDNMYMLEGLLSEEDKKNFKFNPKCIHWPTYMEAYCLGTKSYVLKEQLSDLPNARKAMVRLQRLTLAFQIVVFVIVWRLLVKRVAVARVLWNMVLGWVSKLLQKIPGFARST